jgi:hypothetical protein
VPDSSQAARVTECPVVAEEEEVMPQNRNTLVRTLAYTGWAVVVLTGLDLGLRMAAEVAGVWGVVAASVLFPATIAAAPLYALVWGQWMPAVVVYGGGFAAAMLMARGRGDDPSGRFPLTS